MSCAMLIGHRERTPMQIQAIPNLAFSTIVDCLGSNRFKGTADGTDVRRLVACHLRESAPSEVHSGTRQTAWQDAAILGATSMSCAMLIGHRERTPMQIQAIPNLAFSTIVDCLGSNRFKGTADGTDVRRLVACHLRESAPSEVHSRTRQTAWQDAAILGATSMSCAMLIGHRERTPMQIQAIPNLAFSTIVDCLGSNRFKGTADGTDVRRLVACHLRESAPSEVHSRTRQTAWQDAAILGATSMSCAMLIGHRERTPMQIQAIPNLAFSTIVDCLGSNRFKGTADGTDVRRSVACHLRESAPSEVHSEPDKQLGKTQPSSEQPACHARC